MAQHTPGPWTDDEAGFLGADGRPVGQPEKGKPLLGEVERVRADRRLMCAAPEVFDLMKRLRFFAAFYGSPSGVAAAEGMLASVDAIIARVEGRSDG